MTWLTVTYSRRRYKNIVEADGKYLLTAENKVVFKNSDTDDDAAAPSTAKSANTIPATAGTDLQDAAVQSGAELPTTVAPKKRGRPKKVTADANETIKPVVKKSRTNKSEKETDGNE